MDQNILHSGALYDPNDSTVQAEQLPCLDRLFRFNQIPPSHIAERFAMMQQMFAEVDEGCYIESPLHLPNLQGRIFLISHALKMNSSGLQMFLL